MRGCYGCFGCTVCPGYQELRVRLHRVWSCASAEGSEVVTVVIGYSCHAQVQAYPLSGSVLRMC